MEVDIFTSTKHWKFTQADLIAEDRFRQIQQSARNLLPQSFYNKSPLVHLDLIKSLPLYQLMRTIPKGSLHHLHFICCDDIQFYRRYIINDDRIYVNRQRIQISTKEHAQKNGWISMKEGLATFGETKWLQKLVSLTSFTKKEMEDATYKQQEMWLLFQKKIATAIPLLHVRDIFQKYARYLFQKFIDNGYTRIQFRGKIDQLNEYGADGSFIKRTNKRQYTDIIDRVYEQVARERPEISVGFIYCGLKVFSDELNYKEFKEVCELKWPKLVGLDFVQEEDKFDGLERFDPIINRVLEEVPQLLHLKKVYHAGQTTCHLTNNIDIAIKAGSVRIGHGINILQRPQFLPHCKNVCFEKNPLSNLILGYIKDLREASAHILLGLGYPVSISPDDPGKFGYCDTTLDYFAIAVAYNWSLRHFKLIAYHSINHSVCEEIVKIKLIHSLENAWNKWVLNFIQKEHIENTLVHYEQESRSFKFCKSWSFSQEEKKADQKFKLQKERLMATACSDLYSDGFLERLKSVEQTAISKLIQSMPKGALHSCHLHYCHDVNFFKELLETKINLCVNRKHRTLKSDVSELQIQENWHSTNRLLLQSSIEDLALQLYELTSLSHKQLNEIDDNKEFCQAINHKKKNFLSLLTSKQIFELYVPYVLNKLQKQGYQRVQLRVQPIIFTDTDTGQKYDIKYYFQNLFDLIERGTKNNKFSIGIIVLCNKNSPKIEIKALMELACKLKSKYVVGFDLEQEQPQTEYPSLLQYDSIIDEVLFENQDQTLHKFYQAGFTSDHSIDNINVALRSGSKRILNGVNILQRTQILPRCRNVCFEINPIYEFLSRASGRRDFRLSVSAILLGLAVPVSIGSDFGGLLGIESVSRDLLMAILSYNWSLKHLKLIFLHSIEHVAATEGEKIQLKKSFKQKWSEWINAYNNEADVLNHY